MNTKATSILALTLILLLLWLPSVRGETTLEGELVTGLSLASRNCKLEDGSFLCNDVQEDGPVPYFFESLLELEFNGVFGPGDELKSISEFYHPYTPFSGLTFQGFTAETLIGEIASLEGELIFSPNIILYTTPDRRTESYGATFPRLTFRRFKSTVEFELAGLTANTTLLLDNWQDKPEEKPKIQSGLILKFTTETKEEVQLESETRIGVKDGVTCFGNCIGPLKLQQNAVQEDNGFEEFLVSADNFSVNDIDLNLSGKLSSDAGFNFLSLRGSRTLEYTGFDVTVSSSLAVTRETFLPFAGTSITWSADPLIFSLRFDESYSLENATQTVQFNPDLAEVFKIEELNFGSQALLGKQINVNLTVPTDPVDFTAALRFGNEDGPYVLNSGILSAKYDGDPFGASGILAFRGNSRILKLETELDF